MTDHSPPPIPKSALRQFLDSEALGGILLIAAAALALLAANSGLRGAYAALLHAGTGINLSPRIGPMDVHHWINDGLMAVFFLLVGLEIKREFVEGNLASWERRRLPLIAAVVGMAMPALIYLAAAGSPGLARGWAIPAATDIAFAIGVLALLGKRAPASLKLFLTTVAIADDLGAVAIIAIAYTDAISIVALAAAAAIWLAMLAMARLGVTRLSVFLAAGALLWYAMLLSGVHATVAGVLTAIAIPLRRAPDASAPSPLHKLEHGLAPWVAFAIVPVFGFANAGVALDGIDLRALLAPLPLGIAAGLFAGKQLGILGAVWLSVRLGIARGPQGAGWLQIWGVAMLCGIGFTMSLFIGALAFPAHPELVEQAKIGVLLGSALSAVGGYLALRLAPGRVATDAAEQDLDVLDRG